MNRRVSLFANKSSASLSLKHQEEEIAITKTVSLVIGSFLICWMPITLNFLIVAFSKNRHFLYDYNPTFGYTFGFISVVATHMNSAIDPLIYSYRMEKVWDVAKHVFICESPVENSQNSLSTVA